MLLKERSRLLNDVSFGKGEFDGGVVGLGVQDVCLGDVHAIRYRRNYRVALEGAVYELTGSERNIY